MSVSVLRSGFPGSCCVCDCLLTNCLVVPVRCLGFYLVLLCGPVPVPVLVAVHPVLSSCSLCVVLCGPVYSITDLTRRVFDNIYVTKRD